MLNFILLLGLSPGLIFLVLEYYFVSSKGIFEHNELGKRIPHKRSNFKRDVGYWLITLECLRSISVS